MQKKLELEEKNIVALNEIERQRHLSLMKHAQWQMSQKLMRFKMHQTVSKVKIRVAVKGMDDQKEYDICDLLGRSQGRESDVDNPLRRSSSVPDMLLDDEQNGQGTVGKDMKRERLKSAPARQSSDRGLAKLVNERNLESAGLRRSFSLGSVRVRNTGLNEPEAIHSIRRPCRTNDERTLQRMISHEVTSYKRIPEPARRKRVVKQELTMGDMQSIDVPTAEVKEALQTKTDEIKEAETTGEGVEKFQPPYPVNFPNHDATREEKCGCCTRNSADEHSMFTGSDNVVVVLDGQKEIKQISVDHIKSRKVKPKIRPDVKVDQLLPLRFEVVGNVLLPKALAESKLNNSCAAKGRPLSSSSMDSNVKDNYNSRTKSVQVRRTPSNERLAELFEMKQNGKDTHSESHTGGKISRGSGVLKLDLMSSLSPKHKEERSHDIKVEGQNKYMQHFSMGDSSQGSINKSKAKDLIGPSPYAAYARKITRAKHGSAGRTKSKVKQEEHDIDKLKIATFYHLRSSNFNIFDEGKHFENEAIASVPNGVVPAEGDLAHGMASANKITQPSFPNGDLSDSGSGVNRGRHGGVDKNSESGPPGTSPGYVKVVTILPRKKPIPKQVPEGRPRSSANYVMTYGDDDGLKMLEDPVLQWNPSPQPDSARSVTTPAPPVKQKLVSGIGVRRSPGPPLRVIGRAAGATTPRPPTSILRRTQSGRLIRSSISSSMQDRLFMFQEMRNHLKKHVRFDVSPENTARKLKKKTTNLMV
jgi:hypothetical protein